MNITILTIKTLFLLMAVIQVSSAQSWVLGKHKPTVFIRSIDFSADGRTAASGGSDSVRVWDVWGKKLKQTIDPGATLVKFSPDGKILAVVGAKNIRLLDVQTKSTLCVIADAPTSVAFAPDGKSLAGQMFDSIKIWDVPTGKVQRTASAGRTSKGVSFTADGKTLLWVDAKGQVSGVTHEVNQLDLQTGQQNSSLLEEKKHYGPLAFAADGSLIAGRKDATLIGVWDTRTGKLKQTFTYPHTVLYSVEFAPDGKTLASSGFEPNGWQGIKVWDIRSSELVENVDLPCRIRTTAFSPDGTLLIGGCGDSSVRLWRIAP